MVVKGVMGLSKLSEVGSHWCTTMGWGRDVKREGDCSCQKNIYGEKAYIGWGREISKGLVGRVRKENWGAKLAKLHLCHPVKRR